MMQPVFTETQGQGWWVIILLLLVIAVIARRVFFVTKTSKYALPKGIKIFMAVILLVPIGALFICITASLQTTIDAEGVHYKYFPLINKERNIPWENVNKAYVRAYKPLGEYGGWGVRDGGDRGVAYNAAGDEGLQLVLKNGKKILIGTQKPGELKASLIQLVKERIIDSAVSE